MILVIYYEIQFWNDSLQIGAKQYSSPINAVRAFRNIKNNREGAYYCGGEKIDISHVYDSDCIDKDIVFINWNENLFIELKKIEIKYED